MIYTTRSHRHSSTLMKVGVGVATCAVAVTFAAVALGSSSTSIGWVSNSALGERILTGPSGRTLYMLSPETSSRLLCRNSECMKFWPPLTASSVDKVRLGAGVHGKVGLLRRSSLHHAGANTIIISNGVSQVTLNGHPLYYFSGDRHRDEVNGQNFKSFGGTWEVLGASGQPSSKAPGSGLAPSAPASSGSEMFAGSALRQALQQLDRTREQLPLGGG